MIIRTRSRLGQPSRERGPPRGRRPGGGGHAWPGTGAHRRSHGGAVPLEGKWEVDLRMFSLRHWYFLNPFVWGDPPGACKGRDRLTQWCEGDPG
jgi:hypothetical protein